MLVLGPVERFPDAKHVTSYVGLIPQEESSSGRQRFGHLTKQGNRLLRFLLVEAAQIATRYDAGTGRAYRRFGLSQGYPSAEMAVARKLAIRLYIMLAIRSITKILWARFACRNARGCSAGLTMAETLIELPTSLVKEEGVRMSHNGPSRDRIDVWWNLATAARRALNQERQTDRWTDPTTGSPK